MTLLLAASQQHKSDSKITEQEDIGITVNRWGSPKTTTQLDNIRRDGIPKTSQKQTDWCLSLRAQWASHRRQKIAKQSETAHPLLDNFTKMTKILRQFWLPKFVIEVRKCNGEPYSPSTLPGLLRLGFADRPLVDLLNAP